MRMIETRNDLPEKTRKQMVGLLNESLAATIDLYTHAKQAHWNVRGVHFMALHELFDKVSQDTLPWVDDIAERAGQLGGEVSGTLRQAAKGTSLKEYPLGIAEDRKHAVALADSLGEYAKLVRSAINQSDDAGDADTADLFTQISREVDKMLWFVESHVVTIGSSGSSANSSRKKSGKR